MHSSSYSAAIWDDEEPRTLCDWVKNFRIKKIQMKRKLRSGGDLRVCAILSTALLSAEHELRRKQQERFNRWLEMQSRFDNKPTPPQPTTYVSRSCAIEQHLVNTAGSSSNNDYINNNHNNHRDEINNIWKCELNSLDEFMRNISSKSSSSKCGANNKNETLVFQNGDLQQQCDEIINSTSNSNSNLINTTTPNSIEVAS